VREVDVSSELLPRHHEVMRCLGLLGRVVKPDLWCLVGGMMVLVTSSEAGRADSRGEATKDGDVVVDVVTEADALERVARELTKLGYVLLGDDDRGTDFARCTFVSGLAQLDVLAPDDATRGQLDVGAHLRSIAIPGGRRALAGSTMARIRYAEEAHDVELRVPTLMSAVIVKAAAALDPRTADHPRHIRDTAFLLACIANPRAARDELIPTDHAILRRLLTEHLRTPSVAAWTHLDPDDHDRALAAAEILTR
jgi:hypothetical protein